ncbi:MAG: nuclear transport factor 2 family protein [Bacteroidota bacterium]
MKTAIIFFFLLAFGSLTKTASAQTADNQATFEAYLKKVYTAFETSGFEGLKKYYSPEATEISPDGRLTQGLAALQADWAAFEKMMDAKPKFTYKLTSWRLLTPEIAVITWDSEGEFSMQGQKIVGKNTSSAVLRKVKGNWLIEFDQLTPKMPFPDFEADQAAINALGKEAYAAFEARDAARFAAIYAEDVDFISPYGMVLKGRKAVELAHAELFKAWTNMPKSQIEIGELNLRFLSPDVAVSQWSQKETMMMDGKPMTHEASFISVCQRVDGKWLVSAFSITPVTPPPGMPVGKN